MNSVATIILAVLFAAHGDPDVLKGDAARTSYSIGYQVGRDMLKTGVAVDAAALVRGLEDALGGAAPLVPAETMQKTLVELKKRVVATARGEKGGNLVPPVRDAAFLAENAGKEGVTTLPSGLQYRVVRDGTGKHPDPDDAVLVNYRATLPDGREFDSTYRDGKPRTFELPKVMKGWQEALPLMREGATWQIVIPPVLAFDDKGPVAGRAVIYELELVSVLPKK